MTNQQTYEWPPIDNSAYKLIETRLDGHMYMGIDGMSVIESIAIEDDGNTWLHVSFARKSRMPDYEDMARIRKIFFKETQKVIMIFPPKEKHVNIHPYCLHFFCCLSAKVLPEFSKNGLL